MQCLGYESEDADSRPVRTRSRAAARVALGGGSSRTSSTPRPTPSASATPASTTASPSDSTSPPQTHEFARPRLPPLYNDGIFPSADDHLQAISSGLSQTGNPTGNDVFDFSFMTPSLSGLPFNSQFGGDPSTWDSSLLQNDFGGWMPGRQSGVASSSTAPPLTAPPAASNPSDGQESSLALYKSSNPPTQSKRMTSGQASLFSALFSLGGSASDSVMPTPSSSYSTPSTGGSAWPSPDAEEDEESATSEESDPEGIRQIVCGTPTLAPTAQSNSLPFVLYSYATMVTRTIYEPLRFAGQMKDWLTERYHRSEESRTGVTMLAGIFHTVWGIRASAADYVPLAASITTQLRQRISQSTSTLGLLTHNEAQNIRTLADALEVITLQMYTAPLKTMLETLAEAAPLFRSTCPEAAHELINLPAKLTHTDISLRHFVVIDVIMSVTTLRPMHYRYNTHFDKDFRDREDMGMQWLNGIPGEFVLIMARINMLLCDYWANVDPAIIAEIEQQLKEFKSAPGKSPDAYLMVARLAVQECWRLAVLIYLYVCLCSADAKDPRVEKAQRSFMRVLDRTKPNRTPDLFLLAPMNIVGRVTYRPKERDIIRQRLLNLQECSHPGTCGNEAVRVLEDIWARTDAEGRAAVWSDARIAMVNVCGI